MEYPYGCPPDIYVDIHVEGQIDQQGISHGYPLSYP